MCRTTHLRVAPQHSRIHAEIKNEQFREQEMCEYVFDHVFVCMVILLYQTQTHTVEKKNANQPTASLQLVTHTLAPRDGLQEPDQSYAPVALSGRKRPSASRQYLLPRLQ